MSRRVRHIHAKPGEHIRVHRHHHNPVNSSSNDNSWLGWIIFFAIIGAFVSC